MRRRQFGKPVSGGCKKSIGRHQQRRNVSSIDLKAASSSVWFLASKNSTLRSIVRAASSMSLLCVAAERPDMSQRCPGSGHPVALGEKRSFQGRRAECRRTNPSLVRAPPFEERPFVRERNGHRSFIDRPVEVGEQPMTATPDGRARPRHASPRPISAALHHRARALAERRAACRPAPSRAA